MTLYEKITKTLKDAGVDYKEIRHEPVRTSYEAALVRGTSLEEGAKSLVFKTDNGFVNLILAGNKLVDKEKVKKLLNLNKLKMASSDEVLKITGCEVGGVPPFGNLFNTPLKVYIDKDFMKNDHMEFNAGDRSISIRLKTKDWLQIVKPGVISFGMLK